MRIESATWSSNGLKLHYFSTTGALLRPRVELASQPPFSDWLAAVPALGREHRLA